MLFNQEIKNINRLIEITQVLLKYGFEDLVSHTRLKALVPRSQRISWEPQNKIIENYTRSELIRMVFEELGPTFVKLAQVLSNRPELPPSLLHEFEKLQNNVKPFPYEKVKEIIETETKQPLDSLFTHFSKQPLAAASIGQTHKAKLQNGAAVVVKIQRPGIKKVIETDLAILKIIARRGQGYLDKLGFTNVMEFIEEFEKTMIKELRYTNEARNIRQFRSFYKDYTNFYIPDVYTKHSTDKILVLEFIKGCKITDIAQLEKWGLKPEEIAEAGMDIYMTQMFEYGYFHADPHPGNILVRQDGVICLIDFGMVGKLSKQDKYAFAGTLISMARQDARGMASHLRKLSRYDEISNRAAFEHDLNEIIEDFATLDVSEMNIAELGTRLQKIVYDYKMKVPGSLFLILRAMAILEGIGKMIHPTFNTYEYLKPYGKKLLREQFSTENIAEEVIYRATQLDSFIRNVPFEVQEILSNIRKGKLNIDVNHQGYQMLVKQFNRTANRMMLSLIIVGLLVASAILASGNGDELPQLSIIGFSIAAGLSVFLWVGNFRNKV